ncbi:MAG: hypothetical protein WKF84_14425 [Pyrinomonadaceae bacterium]
MQLEQTTAWVEDAASAWRGGGSRVPAWVIPAVKTLLVVVDVFVARSRRSSWLLRCVRMSRCWGRGP